MRNNVKGSLFGQCFTSSCLVFDSIWYDAYSTGLSLQVGTISVDVSFLNATTGLYQNSTIQLSPSDTLGRSADGNVVAEMIGTFSSYRSAVELSSMMYFFPSRPVGGTRQQEGERGAMLIPLSLIDLSGKAPNKIGVSYEGFLNQGSPCENPAGSGLGNQLDYYYKIDKLRVAGGVPPKYFAYPTFQYVNNVSATAASAGAKDVFQALVYWIPDPPNALVQIVFVFVLSFVLTLCC